jgi:choline monooxygenase
MASVRKDKSPGLAVSDRSIRTGTVVDGVDCSLAEARGIGNEAYTHDSFLTLERDRLMSPTWTCIGVGSDVPEPGDTKPVEFVGFPLLMVRAENGEVRVFHNVCSHRGVRLVEQAGQVKRVIVCPYHSWSYNLDGTLFSTPHIGGQGKHSCEGFDKKRHPLRRVRSMVWFDMVFINLSGDAPPFEEHIEPIAERWKHYDTSRFHHGGADSRWALELGCNWKLAVENHNDAYHLPWVHPGLNSYSRFEDHYEIVGDDFYAGQGSNAYHPRRPENAPQLPRLPDIPDEWQGRSEYIAIFPNAIVGIHMDHYWSVWLEPVACNRTVERMNLYFVGDQPLADEFDIVRKAVTAEWLQIWSEDQEIVERMQRGRHSPAFQGGVFSPALDAATHQLHRWYARRM